MISLRRLLQSFRDAARGIAYVFKHEQNFRLQIIIGILAVVLAWVFPIRSAERILVLFLVGAVLTMELLNTALEYFADLLKPRLNFHVATVKDIMAGAVFIVSLGAAVIGLMILGPHFLALLK